MKYFFGFWFIIDYHMYYSLVLDIPNISCIETETQQNHGTRFETDCCR